MPLVTPTDPGGLAEPGDDRHRLQQWLTAADRSALFRRQLHEPVFRAAPPEFPVVAVDPERRFQRIDGFGFSLTGGSALLISRLPATERAALLRELFLPGGEGIGVSFLRLGIGASDLSERSFSCDDRPAGEDDFALAHFDIAAGDREVIPLLREIVAIAPALRIIATPWSAPPWMKTNGGFVGGTLRRDCLSVYAAYFVRYIRAMREHGISVHAITPQNEPLNRKNEPSMVMEAPEQAEFVREHLGPALARAGLGNVEVFCWDHNCDRMEYALAVLADPEARRYLSGSAWHLYAGEISALAAVHAAHPDMKLYFTEQWVGSDGQFGPDLLWHARNVLIGSLCNWSAAVFEWNLASDAWCGPHTAGGEARCVGALTIGDGISRNVAYYVIAHAAKFVRPGSVRIFSRADAPLHSVAFLTPEGQIVLLVLNEADQARSFSIAFRDRHAEVRLPAAALLSCVWPAAAT
jgi:glucosylceramidase